MIANRKFGGRPVALLPTISPTTASLIQWDSSLSVQLGLIMMRGMVIDLKDEQLRTRVRLANGRGNAAGVDCAAAVSELRLAAFDANALSICF